MTLRTAYERWQEGLDKAVRDKRWSAYDCEITVTVDEFNRHLLRTPGFKALDWKLIKAMLWTETGAAIPEWKTKPMQIGVAGDPGLKALLSRTEGGELILPPTWQARLSFGSVTTIPSHNIRAGVAYLLMRMAYFEHRTVLAADAPTIEEVKVSPGDSLAKIARTRGSPPEILKRLNDGVSTLRVGQTLKLQKGRVEKVIAGWRPISTTMIAQRYNGGGDPNYARKLDHALALIRKGGNVQCEPH
ncbi:LysM peptidoglycan-binding domain-containing protein [Telluria sp. B2]